MSESTLRIFDDNVLLIPYTVEKTNNGIIIPTKSQSEEVKIICTISLVGPEVKNEDLTEGTVVVIPRHTGRYVEFNKFKYYLVKESDILCIIDGVRMEKREET